ncbi:hypothetical protein GmHk_10G028575 [Glycine max]|nr:hypothetical protein GmHk_10G028575 [Glycine max]
MHTIVYNQNLQSPRIISGWREIRHFYQLIRDHQVMLAHHGQSVFFITIYKSSSPPKSFPKWHSLYHQVPNSMTFTVLLNEYKISCSNLDVPNHMYYFMKDKGFEYLNLEDIVECHILKLEHDGNLFCETQAFQPGMLLVFEFLDLVVNYVLFWPSF